MSIIMLRRDYVKPHFFYFFLFFNLFIYLFWFDVTLSVQRYLKHTTLAACLLKTAKLIDIRIIRKKIPYHPQSD